MFSIKSGPYPRGVPCLHLQTLGYCGKVWQGKTLVLDQFVNYGCKKFYNYGPERKMYHGIHSGVQAIIQLRPGANVILFFSSLLTKWFKRLECLFLLGLLTLFLYLWVRPEARTSLRQAKSILTNIRLGWKSIKRTNTLAYFATLSVPKKKGLTTLALGV